MSPTYTVMIDGVPIQCESAADALALARLHGGGTPDASRGGQPQPAHAQPNNTRWTAPRVTAFFKLLEGKLKQTKMINALLETEDARTDDQLLQMVNVASGMELAGVFAGLYKNAKKVGADPRELYVKKPVTIGDKRGAEYTLHPGFRSAAVGRRPSK